MPSKLDFVQHGKSEHERTRQSAFIDAHLSKNGQSQAQSGSDSQHLRLLSLRTHAASLHKYFCRCCENRRFAPVFTTPTEESERRRREHATIMEIRHALNNPGDCASAREGCG